MTYTPQDFSDFSMLDIFRMEVETQVTLLNDNLLAVESQGQSGGVGGVPKLEALMRSAHAMKGAARIVGLDLAVKVAHVMEDCFVAAQAGQVQLDSQTIDIVIDWYDQLSRVNEANLSLWLERQADATAELVNDIAGLLHAANPGQLDISANASDAVVAPPANPPNDKIHNTISSATIVLDGESASKNAFDRSYHQQMSHTQTSDRVVRVSVDNLNRLMALAGESLVEVNWFQSFADTMLHLKRQQQDPARSLVNRLDDSDLPPCHRDHLAAAQKTAQECYALLSDRLDDLDQFSRRFSQLSDHLYREVIASHMCPLADGVQGFPRMVRDLAKKVGKQVSLDIIGQQTPVDRDILEKLEAPLIHMLRNAIAHGIEAPDQRQQLGKPEAGTIRVEASHRAGMLCISVSDDGQGIDVEDLRQKVIQKNLTTAQIAAQLSETELMEFLFLLGFSTTTQVTEIAGRGVGMDIVHTMVQEVGGLIRVSSVPGQGTTFQFQLPLTLSVIRALVVDISGEPYAFGLNRIDRVLMVKREDVAISENHPYIIVDDEAISLACASQVLELPASSTQSSDHLAVVLLSNQTHRYGLIVDRFLGEHDLVIRPLDPRLQKVQDINAAALSDQGVPILVIDVADLVCSMEQLFARGQLSLAHTPTVKAPVPPKRILVVDDSITVREMERKLLQNFGYYVDVAVNGMEGWNTIRSGHYDLIISDIDMPRMNGIELVQQIKDHPHLHTLPVIIVSYKDRQDDQLAGLNAGADYYLTKSSFHDNRLLTAITDLIG